MNTTSRIVTSSIMIVAGLVFLVLSLTKFIFLLIYAVPLLIIGFFVLFNKHEDRIEQRKDIKRGKI